MAAPSVVETLLQPVSDRPGAVALPPDGVTGETAIRTALTAAEWRAVRDAVGRDRPALGLYGRFAKRGVDVAGAGAALLLLAPVMAALGAAIRLDSPGPALFRQTRIGRGGHPFTVYKFRTMTVQPDGELLLFRAADGAYRHKIPDDPRVTRLGRFLRRSSLDELPQLLNVLRGDMSLVGPRPELPQIVLGYEPWQHRRHLVRPGITGWWQVSGRSHLPMHEHTELDVYYVDHLSFGLDARIMLRTLKVVARGLGAF